MTRFGPLGDSGVSALSRIAAALGMTGGFSIGGAIENTIVPVFNLHDALCQVEIEHNENVDPGGTGGYTLVTVPPGELWMPMVCQVQQQTATCTFSQLVLYDSVASVGMGLAVTSAGQTEIVHTFGLGTALMPAGTALRVTVDAYSTGALKWRLWVGKHVAVTPPRLPSVQTP